MKKLSMILMLALVCGSFAMAQTSNVAKQATLMPAGAVITDVKTGEVVRTTGGTVALPGSINASLTINGVPSGTGTTSKAVDNTGLNNIQTFSSFVNTTTNGPASTSKSAGNGTINSVQPVSGGLINTGSSAPPTNPNVVKPPVNSNPTFTVD